MVARLTRTDQSRKKYPALEIPDVYELRVGEETDLLVGSFPRAEHEPNFCDVLRLKCRTHPQLLSRKHSYIILDEEGCHRIRDLDTLNGTYINGNLIPNELIQLKNGDVIGFGGPNAVCLNGTTTVNPYTYVYKNDDKKYPLQYKKETRIPKKLTFQSPFLSTLACGRGGVWCAACGNHIPEKFVCIKARDMIESTTEAHYHSTMSCLSSFATHIRVMGIDDIKLGEENAQVKNLMTSVKEYFGRQIVGITIRR